MCGIIEATLAVTTLATAVNMYAQSEAQKGQERSAKSAAEYNAQVAENEAATQAELAKGEISKGIADRERQQRQAARAMGDMRANMAASGFELDSGSNLSLLAESAAEHQYDSAVITANAEQSAWQHQVAGLNATNQKSLADWQKSNASSGRGAANLAMAGTLLGGIGTGLGQYNQYQRAQPATSSPYAGYNPNMAFGSNPKLYKGAH